jgi:hypothetical protein
MWDNEPLAATTFQGYEADFNSLDEGIQGQGW